MIQNPSESTSKALILASHSIAFLTTVLRLAHRFNTRRLWWDDFWAFIALLSDLFVWIIFMVITFNLLVIIPNGVRMQPTSLSSQLFLRFGTLIFYTTTLWTARVSVAVTIVRLLNQGHFRTVARTATLVLGAFWLSLVIQKVFICGREWHSVQACPIPLTTGYLELGTDLAGDLWLLIAPAYMLCGMRIMQRHRRLILGIFGCGILTTAVCLVHIYLIVSHSPGWPGVKGNTRSPGWLGITGHLQLGASIVVCNLLVLLTYIYRVFRNDSEDDSEDSSEDYSTQEENIAAPEENIEECRWDSQQDASGPLAHDHSTDSNMHTTILTSVTEQITFTDIETSLSNSFTPENTSI